MSQEEILNNILEIEEREGLNELRIEGIPIWNGLKYRLRGYHMVEMGCDDITAHSNAPRCNLFKMLKDSYRSLKNILQLLHTRDRKSYCFVGFTRLEKINDLMIDKFVDPVISEMGLKDDEVLYLNNENIHPKNRNSEHSIIYTDFINYLSAILTVLVFPILYIRNRSTYNKLSSVIRTYFTNNKNAVKYLYAKSSIILIQRKIYRSLFKRLPIQALIGVARPTFIPQALAAKSLGIKVIELQHGITHGPTKLYSGVYNCEIDPDLFCTFGDVGPRSVFNIEESKIINIGFALNSYISRTRQSSLFPENVILVISEPGSSAEILSTVILLAKMYPELEFHLRRHPQEKYSDSQKELIDRTLNITDATSNECSQLAILPYRNIIGENSSVLFEALTMGKKVGRLNCNGLTAYGYSLDKEDGFYYINDLQYFKTFLLNNSPVNCSSIYSKFNADVFKSLISVEK